jgi:PmbA protein
MMDILTELARQADQVEVIDVQTESTEIGFKANQLKASQVTETNGVAVRVVKDGKLGFAASSDKGAMDRLVQNALESAAFGDPIPVAFPGPQPAPTVRTYDGTITDLPIARLVEIGQEVVDYLCDIEPEAQVDVDLTRGIQAFTIRNQAGTDVAIRRSPLSIRSRVSRVQGDDVLMMFDMAGTTLWQDDYLAFARRLGQKLMLARKSASIKSGQMPVLFAPSGALVLGLPLMLGLNGKNIYTRISPLAGKVGTTVFDPKITVVDDATLDGRFGSASHDDEGVAHKRNVLIQEGVLQGYLYDLKTAAQSGVQSTGNGSRGLFSPPQPAPSNFVLQNGDTPLAEMLAGIDEGLLVENVLGLGQGNVISGAFSNSLSLAFKIEKGAIGGRVKDVSIAGNIYDLLKNVAAVSRESEWVYSSYSLPYILLEGINVVAAAT